MADSGLITEKFQNAVLFILQNSSVRPGITSLLKMLYFADSQHYRSFLSSITGSRYVAIERGPVVDDYKRHFEDLVEFGIVREREVPILGVSNPKKEYEPLYEPDYSVFSSTELHVLSAVVRECGTISGSVLSQRSHLEGPWVFAWDSKSPGRPIPNPLFRWLDNLPDEFGIERAKARIEERGLSELISELPATRA
ncbi:MAG: Panacea domain-containing protein [Chloroflexota bacterium]